MKFKKTLFFLILSCLLIVFAGCGDKSEQPINLTIWHVYGAQTDSPLNDLIEEFNATVGKDEGIQVEVTMVSDNKVIYEDIVAAANEEPGAPELPNIFVSYPKTVLSLPDEEILIDFNDYFSQKELDQFIPAFIEDGTVNDRLVVLPIAKSTEICFINKTDFDRYAEATGASIDDLRHWDTLYETACDYAAWTEEQTGTAKALFVHDYHFNYFQVGVESLGEDFFNGESIAFGPAFDRIWEPYARAAISGGLWLQGGYATEPLRTGESIVSVASSASVLYYSTEVIYPDNTSEEIELMTIPCPTFADGDTTVMQRGAGMCVVKTTPEQDEAAVTFLKWLADPEINSRFVVSTGYMPVTQEAFDTYMPKEIETLTESKYIELYKGYEETQKDYTFFVAPLFENYQTIEEDFEDKVRLCLNEARNEYLAGGGGEALLDELVASSLVQFKSMMQ